MGQISPTPSILPLLHMIKMIIPSTSIRRTWRDFPCSYKGIECRQYILCGQDKAEQCYVQSRPNKRAQPTH
jgi:hypothetical protein